MYNTVSLQHTFNRREILRRLTEIISLQTRELSEKGGFLYCTHLQTLDACYKAFLTNCE